jgi:hypothetical protein
MKCRSNFAAPDGSPPLLLFTIPMSHARQLVWPFLRNVRMGFTERSLFNGENTMQPSFLAKGQ